MSNMDDISFEGCELKKPYRAVEKKTINPDQGFSRVDTDLSEDDYHGMFDSIYYLESYSDVRISGMDPSVHYNIYGWMEGRNPAPFFDTKLYLAWHDDVRNAMINPFSHYTVTGRQEGRITFVVNSTLAQLLEKTCLDRLAINIDAAHRMRRDIYHAATSNRQKGILAVKFQDPKNAIIFLIKSLRNSLHDGPIWATLAHLLRDEHAGSYATYAAQAAMRFDEKTVSNNALLDIRQSECEPLWADMF